MMTIEQTINHLDAQLAKLVAERTHITAVLRAFYQAPISMSSVQPIIDLAIRLNPDLEPK